MIVNLKDNKQFSSMLLIGAPKTGKSEIVHCICNTLHTAYITPYCLFKASQMFHHIKHKPSYWNVYEESTCLANCFQIIVNCYDVIVLDNISAWIANLVTLKLNVYNEIDQLVLALKLIPRWIIITGEVCNCITTGSLWASYTCILSNANKRLALITECVYVTIAGLVLRLK